MPTNHELYGELLTAKEVCEVTSFTMNQLRNWRVPARRELAPFGFIAIGGSPFYRKIVVQAWLDENGAQQGIYYPSEFDKRFPVGEAQALSVADSIALSTLNRLTSANVDSWINGKLSSAGLAWVKVWQGAWADVEKALGLEPNFILPQNRWDNPSFWSLAVHTARKLINEEQNLGMSLEKILAIGSATAPVKESKF